MPRSLSGPAEVISKTSSTPTGEAQESAVSKWPTGLIVPSGMNRPPGVTRPFVPARSSSIAAFRMNWRLSRANAVSCDLVVPRTTAGMRAGAGGASKRLSPESVP